MNTVDRFSLYFATAGHRSNQIELLLCNSQHTLVSVTSLENASQTIQCRGCSNQMTIRRIIKGAGNAAQGGIDPAVGSIHITTPPRGTSRA